MKISACLIGEDSLLIQCGNMLLERGHSVVAVITPLTKIKAWAKKNNIICLSKVNELAMSRHSFDYLFSIVNSCILDGSIIEMAHRAAINYHDAPLPKYAGLNATSWALINGEKLHGVSWHLMDQEIDTGSIVSQQFFTIDPQDTALSLNLKCYQHAIKAFEQVLIDIENDRLQKQKQLLKERTYYGKDHLLPYLGFIDCYSQSAEDIFRIYNGLTMGLQNNSIGTLKIYLTSYYFIVSKLDLAEESSNKNISPGTLFLIEKDILYISTQRKSIKILELLMPDGTVITKEILMKFGIKVGYQLPKINQFCWDNAENFYRLALKKEKSSISNLISFREHTIFNSIKRSKSEWLSGYVVDCTGVFFYKENNPIMLASVLIYLYRLNNYEEFSIFFVHQKFKDIKNNFSGLFSIIFPFLFKVQEQASIREVLHFMDKNKLMSNATNLTDIKVRYPKLRSKITAPYIIINFTGDSLELSALPDETNLYIQVNEKAASIQIFYRAESKRNLSILSYCTKHIKRVVLEISKNVDTKITEFSFLSQAEKKILLNWGIGKDYPISKLSIPELFEKQAMTRADQVAVIFNGDSITYSQLQLMARSITQYIYKKRNSQQPFIGIYFNRSIEMIAVILGILKAKAVYVPIDIHYPPERIKQIIKQTRLSLVITQESFLESLCTLSDESCNSFTVISYREILKMDFQESKNTKICTDTIDSLAYVMFTSGTTGKPKGVMITQRNILNYCNWFLDTTRFDATSTIDFSSSIAFDLSVPCSIAPLLIGGKIAICSEQDKLNPEKYLQHLINYQVTHIEITPGYLNLLLKYPYKIGKLRTLKYLLLGADTLHKNDIIKWNKLCPKSILVNEYGPTETTVAVTSYFIEAGQLACQSSIPIGSPAYNTQCYVLDKYNNFCPIGMAGELCIAGEQVSCGYLGQDDITRQRFIRLNILKRERVYKTGDKVVWLPNGNLQFLGRTDREIKIQGYRVDPSEIESVLEVMPGIQQAVVTVSNNKVNNTCRLTAYLVCDKLLKNNQPIIEFLSLHLPKFMIPEEFVLLDKVPLKDNEKIDLNSLEKHDKIVLPSKYQKASYSEIGETVQRSWQQALNKFVNIEMDTNFFDLGGDSLAAVRVVDILQRQYSIDIELHSLFQHPTISQLEMEINRLLTIKKNGLKKARASLKHKALSIVPLSKGESKYPLFLIHPVGGTLFWYYPIVALLSGKYTIYGIQDPNIDYCIKHFSSLSEMARYYLDDIKTILSPHDNYYLAGASFGATVAFEMANQLLQEKKQVAFLGLLDGWAYYPKLLMQTPITTTLSRQPLSQKINRKRQEQLQALEFHRKKLLDEYLLPFLNLNVHLFKAEQLWSSFETIQNEYNGWRPYIGGEINVHLVPGGHKTMFFDPHITSLVSCICPHLR